MDIGDADGDGRYGVLDEDGDGLLCHECGRRFAHLGVHAWKGHGITAVAYRDAHGLARSRGLVASGTREAIIANARNGFAARKEFVAARDPAAASAARLGHGHVACRAGGQPVPAGPGSARDRGRVRVVRPSVLPARPRGQAAVLLPVVRQPGHAGRR